MSRMLNAREISKLHHREGAALYELMTIIVAVRRIKWGIKCSSTISLKILRMYGYIFNGSNKQIWESLYFEIIVTPCLSHTFDKVTNVMYRFY